MKRVIQTAVVGIFLAAAQNAFASSAFPAAAEANVGQPALSTYADRHEEAGTLLVDSGSPFPASGEDSVGQGPLDTYADARARAGDMLGSAESPFPIAADVDVSKWTVDPKVSV